MGSHVQPVVGRSHRRWLLRWRGRAASRGRCRDRRWHGRRREHTHSVGLLRYLWIEAGPGACVVRGNRQCVVLSFSIVRCRRVVWSRVRPRSAVRSHALWAYYGKSSGFLTLYFPLSRYHRSESWLPSCPPGRGSHGPLGRGP